jgi:hypothetical protein
MKFYRVNKESLSAEYGQARTMTWEWIAELTLAEHQKRIDVAHLAIRKAFIAANLLPQRMTIELIQMQPDGVARYRVTGEYEDRARNQIYPKVSLSTNMESVQTSFDAYGNPLLIEYGGVTQVATADVFRPRVNFTIAAQVDLAAYGYTLNDLLDAWVGKINASQWYGFLPQTVLCVGINASQNYETYDLTTRVWNLEFQYVVNPDTWLQWVYYRAPDGTIPADSPFYQFTPYVIEEFNALFPFAGYSL